MHERFIKYTNITHQISQLHNLYNYLISLTNTNFDVISSLTCIYLFCYHTTSERQSRLFYGMWRITASLDGNNEKAARVQGPTRHWIKHSLETTSRCSVFDIIKKVSLFHAFQKSKLPFEAIGRYIALIEWFTMMLMRDSHSAIWVLHTWT